MAVCHSTATALTRQPNTVTLLRIGHGDSQLVDVINLVLHRHGALKWSARQQMDNAQATVPAEDCEYGVCLVVEERVRWSLLPVEKKTNKYKRDISER